MNISSFRVRLLSTALVVVIMGLFSKWELVGVFMIGLSILIGSFPG